MRIHSLEFFRFRNLQNQTLSFPSRVTVLSGRNGQGKTSVLEAITLLAFGKSFRTSSLRDMISWNNEELRVKASCESSVGQFEIAYELTSEGRKVFVNGNPISSATEFFGRVKAVEFSPDDLLIVKDAPAVRRQFLDRSLATVDPFYVPVLVRYQRALRQRNALLTGARRRGENASNQALKREAQSWAEVLAEAGVEITKRREKFVADIQEIAAAKYHKLAAQNEESRRETVSLAYRASFSPGEESIADRFSRTFADELRQGTTLIGSHRDDLTLLLDSGTGPRDARRFASQGQMRTIVLALKLATHELIRESTGEPPVLLLDDVDSELDVMRKNALLEEIGALSGQVIVTTTDEKIGERSALRDLKVLRLQDGLVM